MNKDLGTMNGWQKMPVEYTKHTADCGCEYSLKDYFGPKEYAITTSRKYNMTITQRGKCYHNYYCNDCGISYNVDSSD